jgi:hypothetical protein
MSQRIGSKYMIYPKNKNKYPKPTSSIINIFVLSLLRASRNFLIKYILLRTMFAASFLMYWVILL